MMEMILSTEKALFLNMPIQQFLQLFLKTEKIQSQKKNYLPMLPQ